MAVEQAPYQKPSNRVNGYRPETAKPASMRASWRSYRRVVRDRTWWLAVLALPFKSNSWLEAENAVLRHQLIVLRRKMRRRAETWSVSTSQQIRRLNGLRASLPTAVSCDLCSLCNDIRTHRSLHKDAPVSRPVQWTEPKFAAILRILTISPGLSCWEHRSRGVPRAIA